MEILRAGLLSEKRLHQSPDSPTKENCHISLLSKLKICDLDSLEEVKSFGDEVDTESVVIEDEPIPQVKITTAPPLIEE
jgi:hypothetical protein